MKRIWRTEIPFEDNKPAEVALYGKIVHAGIAVEAEKPSVEVWTESSVTDAIATPRTFKVYRTGNAIPDDEEYVATVQETHIGLTLHIYEVK
jgi:hypothetical protein